MSQVQAIDQPNPPRPRVTYEEFLAGDWGTNHVEWVDGEVVMMSAVSGQHDDVVGFLSMLLRALVAHRKLGKVRGDPFQMKTGPDLPSRAPDLVFIARENLERLGPQYLEGPADLVIEVISPGSNTLDRGEKFEEYEKGGVREYWIIDPIRRRAEFHQLDENGMYRPAEPVEGVYSSQVIPGFWIKVEWLWELPEPFEVFAQWGLP